MTTLGARALVAFGRNDIRGTYRDPLLVMIVVAPVIWTTGVAFLSPVAGLPGRRMPGCPSASPVPVVGRCDRPQHPQRDTDGGLADQAGEQERLDAAHPARRRTEQAGTQLHPRRHVQ